MKRGKVMNINEITIGMTPQVKEIYFAHQEKRHREEAEKVQAERERLQVYKQSLIDDILKYNSTYSIEELQRMTTRTLERICY